MASRAVEDRPPQAVSAFPFRLLPSMWVPGTELRSWEQGMSVPACYTISVATVSFLQEKK